MMKENTFLVCPKLLALVENVEIQLWTSWSVQLVPLLTEKSTEVKRIVVKDELEEEVIDLEAGQI